MNPAEDIAAIASRLEAQSPPEDSPEARFCAGVRRWLSEGGNLDQALELGGGVGIDAARTRYLRAVRDEHLKAAHALCEGDSAWSRSIALAGEIRRFGAVIWRRWRALDEPPEGCSELRRHLFFARKAGELPETTRGLHKVCTGL